MFISDIDIISHKNFSEAQNFLMYKLPTDEIIAIPDSRLDIVENIETIGGIKFNTIYNMAINYDFIKEIITINSEINSGLFSYNNIKSLININYSLIEYMKMIKTNIKLDMSKPGAILCENKFFMPIYQNKSKNFIPTYVKDYVNEDGVINEQKLNAIGKPIEIVQVQASNIVPSIKFLETEIFSKIKVLFIDLNKSAKYIIRHLDYLLYTCKDPVQIQISRKYKLSTENRLYLDYVIEILSRKFYKVEIAFID